MDGDCQGSGRGDEGERMGSGMGAEGDRRYHPVSDY